MKGERFSPKALRLLANLTSTHNRVPKHGVRPAEVLVVQREGVLAKRTFQLTGTVQYGRPVVDVLASDGLAHGRVILREQDVRMPELVHLCRDGYRSRHVGDSQCEPLLVLGFGTVDFFSRIDGICHHVLLDDAHVPRHKLGIEHEDGLGSLVADFPCKHIERKLSVVKHPFGRFGHVLVHDVLLEQKELVRNELATYTQHPYTLFVKGLLWEHHLSVVLQDHYKNVRTSSHTQRDA